MAYQARNESAQKNQKSINDCFFQVEIPKKREEIEKQAYKIPLVPAKEGFVSLPNFLFQEGLTTIGSSKEKIKGQLKEVFEEKIIWQGKNRHLKFKGDKLNINNCPYFGAILKEYAKAGSDPFGKKMIRAEDIYKSANKKRSNYSKNDLLETLDWMAEGRLIYVDERGIRSNFGFLNFYEANTHRGYIQMEIHPKIGELMSRNFVQLNVKRFNDLKGGITKFLYCLIESNKKLSHIYISKIKELIQSKTKGNWSEYEFKRKIKSSLSILYKKNIIKKYFSPGSKKLTDKIYIKEEE